MSNELIECVHCAGTIYNHHAGCPVAPPEPVWADVPYVASSAFPPGMDETVRPAHDAPANTIAAVGICPECGVLRGHEQSCSHYDAWMSAMPHFDVCHRCGSSYQVGLPHDCRRATTRCMQHWNYSLDKWVDDAIIEPALGVTFTPAECNVIRGELSELRQRVASLELELSAKKGELE